jgi:hypothetical protein
MFMLYSAGCGPHESDYDDNSLKEYYVLGVYLILIDVTGSPKISVHIYKITWSGITEELTLCHVNQMSWLYA